jgi:hypothetical protein
MLLERMLLIAKKNISSTIAGITILFLAGICGGGSSVLPSHQCCPNPVPAQQNGDMNPCCFRMERPTVTASLPSLRDQKPLVESADAAPLHSLKRPSPTPVSFEPVILPEQQQFIKYRQLLL